MHMRMDLGEIHCGFMAGNAERASMALRMGGMCRGQQRLGGHAARIEAIAAHQVLFNQYNRSAHLHGAGCHRKSA